MRWVSTSVSVRILQDRDEKKISPQRAFKLCKGFLGELKPLEVILCVLLLPFYLNLGS